MPERISRARALLAGLPLLITAAVAGVTLAVLTLLGVTFQGDGEGQTGGGSEFTGTALLTANRDRYAICVDVVDVPASLREAAKDELERAFSEAQEDVAWAEAGLDENSPTVDVGCPRGPAALEPGAQIRSDKYGLAVHGNTTVEEASLYRVFVFVLSEDQLNATFGDALPVATQEFLRISIDQFMPVTMGLYVTLSHLDDHEYLARWLLVLGNARSYEWFEANADSTGVLRLKPERYVGRDR